MTPLTVRQQARFNAAIDTGYLIDRLLPTTLYNAWYRHCRIHQLPFLAVKRRARTTTINLDLLPAGRVFTAAGREGISDLFSQHAAVGSFGIPGTDAAAMHRMPSERVDAIVSELLRLVEHETVPERAEAGTTT